MACCSRCFSLLARLTCPRQAALYSLQLRHDSALACCLRTSRAAGRSAVLTQRAAVPRPHLPADVSTPGGRVTLKVSYLGFQIYTESSDLCSRTSCPLAPGPVAITYVQNLPPIAPPVGCRNFVIKKSCFCPHGLPSGASRPCSACLLLVL